MLHFAPFTVLLCEGITLADCKLSVKSATLSLDTIALQDVRRLDGSISEGANEEGGGGGG